MRRLTPRALRARLGEERGAVGVMVALMLVPLLGFAAIAVDVSAVHSERQQLRNGTDAAALAVATDCAWNPATCGGNPAATASSLVARNSGQVGATLAAPVVTTDVPGSRVTVTATARQEHWFAPVLGRDASQVTATSSAGWTGISRATVQLPLAISRCEYDKHRASSTVTMQASNSGCTGAGQSTMRFVWLATDSGSVCRTTATVGAQVTQSTGGATSMPAGCENAGSYLTGLAGTTILLPVVDDAKGAGGAYRVQAFAAFQVTGYDLGGSTPWSEMTFWQRVIAIIEFLIRIFTGASTKDGGLGIEGRFTTYVELSDAPVQTSAPDLGARSVFLTEQR